MIGESVLERHSAELQRIGDAVVRALPKGWERAWLQVEAEPSAVSVACFYTGAGASKPTHAALPDKISMLFHDLHRAAGADAWSQLTFAVDRSGKFNADFGYEPVPTEGMYERRLAWKDKVLPKL